MPKTHRAAVCLLALLLAARSAIAAPPPAVRPLLVTVDDLPIGGRLHAAPAERRAITDGLLAALARHQVPAVGLVTWGNVHDPSDETLLDLWLKAGLELGNHSYRHLSYTDTDAAAYVADVEKARVTIEAFLEPRGQRLRFFRFPFLREGDTEAKLDAMRAYLERTGHHNLPVTVDFEDWSFDESWTKAVHAGDGAAQEMVAADYLAALRLAVRRHEAMGDALFGRELPQVLLLHANLVGTANWDAAFTGLEKSGHRFARADEVLADPAFAEPHRFVAVWGVGLWDRLADEKRQKAAQAEVAALLEKQSEAWNRADLSAFCSVYAEDASFVGPAGIFRGREAILERYRKRYGGDRAGMGTLSLEVVEARTASGVEESLLGDAVPSSVHGVSVVARWRLRYPDKPELSGLTLIVFRRRGGSWQIVQDASM